MAASDAKAAYEAVATQLKTPQLTTAVDAFELPYTVAPRLRVDTMPKVLACPLAVHEVDQLAVAYTLSPGVVLLPAMSARVDNTNAWRKTLARVEPIVWDVLWPTSRFRLALAHVALDATGSSACLTPASRLPHTIGTVVISLPTFHRGGNVTFAGGRHRSYCTQHATTTHVCARDDNTETTDTMFFHNCTRGLQLEAYAQQHALQGRWLYNRLPDAIVALVSSYLKPRVSMLRLLERKIYDPLFVVGVAIVDVKAQGLALNDYWYAAVVVQSFLVGEYDYDDVRYNVQTVIGLLAAGARTGHLDAVLTQCVVDRELVVVPALVAVAHRCPSLATPAFIASASSVILNTIVRNESALPSMDAMLRAYFASLPTHRGHGPRTCVVASAFEFIRTHDRANLGGFTDKWLASRPSTTLLYDAIVLLQSTLGLIESDVLVRLGMAYLDATSYRESDVVYADYCLHAIAVPEACCSSCGDFGRFLLAPLEVEHRFCVEHLCASIMAVVSAHPLQLRTHEHSVLEFGDVTMWGNAIGYTTAAPTPVVDILKVRQPGQLLPSDLRRCLKQSKTTSTSTVYRRGVVDELMTRLKAATMREETRAATAE
ncbi:hypothetical protein SDRG_03595 [Saprolegnia diclina VS20]|uniref:Uncharacterized protein n=1 Tax=Saprolegnia diclina (strain VS20) TaxID=1156394 RepID=T0S2X1_SAPDV|nr:hypothetical protein SDRG_03595 [Saprolegnia diclina VS20]EQC39393.1 hypothetical protein SDRG_03595 [Saprolegnia diclina VS20]|eukprot:XP_008607454.1 hypothetical protein SDRG_03595 [Saprolegnia diclina VS20]